MKIRSEDFAQSC